jgi:hypothetical protein
MRKFLAVAVVLAAGTFAMGDISHWVVEVDNSVVMPPNCYTFDLGVTVSADDDWLLTRSAATITDCPDCVFYQHPTYDGDWPQPSFFGLVPELEFDSFYTTPTGFPNTDVAPSGGAGFAEGPDKEDCYQSAVWFDTANTGAGSYVVARYTVCGDMCDGATMTIYGNSHIYSDGGGVDHPFEFSFTVPEPASLALLGLGLFLIRRR